MTLLNKKSLANQYKINQQIKHTSGTTIIGIEALVIAGRPLLITLPLTIVFVGFMITSSYLDPMEFLVEAPILEIILFIVAIFVFVGLAYYIGGKKILKSDMAENLRNDTLV